jgi:hypothetical protein
MNENRLITSHAVCEFVCLSLRFETTNQFLLNLVRTLYHDAIRISHCYDYLPTTDNNMVGAGLVTWGRQQPRVTGGPDTMYGKGATKLIQPLFSYCRMKNKMAG